MSNELTSFDGEDQFLENTTVYGRSPGLYLRVRPTTSTTITLNTGHAGETSFVIKQELGHLLAGSGPSFPAFMAKDANGIDGAAVSVMNRNTWRSNYDIELTPRLSIYNGGAYNPATDDGNTYYCYGVWARLCNGTFVARAGSVEEYHHSTDGYFFGIMSRDFASAGPHYFFVLLRLNAGTITILGQREHFVPFYDGTDATLYGEYGPTRVRLECETVSGDVELRAFYDDNRSNGNGETAVSWAGNTTYTDNDVNKIDEPGRAGFCIPAARAIGSLGNEYLVTARKFIARDLAIPTTPFIDDNLFTRRDLGACLKITDSISQGTGETGECLMSLYSGDNFGNQTTTSGLGNGFYDQFNRSASITNSAEVGDVIDTGTVHQTMGWNISQRESFDNPDARVLGTFTMRSFSGQQTSIGVALRAIVQDGEYSQQDSASNRLDSYKRGYVAFINYNDLGGNEHIVEVYHYGGGARTLIANSADIGALSYGTEIDLDFEIQNIDVGGGTIRPAMRVTVDATQVVLVPQVSGVTFNSTLNILIDDRQGATVIGPGFGFVVDRDSPGDQTTSVVTFNSLAPKTLSTDFNLGGGGGVGEDEDDSTLPSEFFLSEVDGAAGTLDIPVHWPVTVEEKWLVHRHPVRNTQVMTRPRSQSGRLRWTVSVPADDVTEATYLRSFASTHGAAVPFLWTEPINGDLVYGRFTEDSVRTLIRAPQSIGGYEFEIDELFNPYDFELPEASFDLYDPVAKPWSDPGPVWQQAHVTDKKVTFTITVSLSGTGAGIDGTLVAYTVVSSPGYMPKADEGVHYDITGGASPLTFNEGETSKTITVTVYDRANTYFVERSLMFQFDQGASSYVTFADDRQRDFRLFIRSSYAPPAVDFGASTSNWSGGSSGNHLVQMSRSGNTTDEETGMWFTVSGGTAVYGTDFRINPASLPGDRTIGSGVSNGNIVIEVLEGYTATRTVQLSIDYENASGADKNIEQFGDTTRAQTEIVPQIGTTRPGVSELQPQVPSARIYGPDGALDGTGVPWDSFVDSAKLTTQGQPAEGLTFRYRDYKGQTAYYRDGFDHWFFCDAEAPIEPFELFNQFSVYWAAATGKPKPRFIGLTWRDRPSDTNTTIIFDREATGGNTDYDGNAYTGSVTTDEGVWNLYRTQNGLGGSVGAWGSGSGGTYVVEETITNPDQSTSKHTRLYGEYNATAGEVATGYPVVLLFWPVYDSAPAIKNNGDRKTREELDGTSCLVYGIMKKQASTAHSVPPDRYWPRPRIAYEPRGNAVAGTTTTTHTITL